MTAPFQPYITEPGHYPQLDETRYHADPVVGGSLSSTGARTLITRTPAHFAYQREHGRPDTDAFDLGRATHAQLLGVGGPIVEVNADSWRTNAAKTARAEARKAGATPLLIEDANRVRAAVAAVHAHPVVGPLFARPGRAEQSYVGRCPETGVMCRIRIDWQPDTAPGQRAIAVDYKTTTDASPDHFGTAMGRYGYHQQGPFYGDVLLWLGLATAVQTVFVVQEKDPPYLVSYGWPDAEAVEWGRVLNRKARDVFAHCTESGEWPGYSTQPIPFELPGWLKRQYEDADDTGAYLIREDITA
ncbi:MAG: PD-(D/E)XK nuclease-like domain-containing protein [Pseudonocardia sp.]|nr:PD-(D/E)XK nuclease-like domain-containing protein [Pseudonocardia sp.]